MKNSNFKIRIGWYSLVVLRKLITVILRITERQIGGGLGLFMLLYLIYLLYLDWLRNRNSSLLYPIVYIILQSSSITISAMIRGSQLCDPKTYSNSTEGEIYDMGKLRSGERGRKDIKSHQTRVRQRTFYSCCKQTVINWQNQ